MSVTIVHAKAALASAHAAYLEELRQDCERSEGSEAQESRRAAHQQSLRDEIARCESNLKRLQHQEMVSAFEAKYQRDWNDPAGNDMKAVWADAWAAAASKA